MIRERNQPAAALMAHFFLFFLAESQRSSSFFRDDKNGHRIRERSFPLRMIPRKKYEGQMMQGYKERDFSLMRHCEPLRIRKGERKMHFGHKSKMFFDQIHCYAESSDKSVPFEIR